MKTQEKKCRYLKNHDECSHPSSTVNFKKAAPILYERGWRKVTGVCPYVSENSFEQCVWKEEIEEDDTSIECENCMYLHLIPAPEDERRLLAKCRLLEEDFEKTYPQIQESYVKKTGRPLSMDTGCYWFYRKDIESCGLFRSYKGAKNL